MRSRTIPLNLSNPRRMRTASNVRELARLLLLCSKASAIGARGYAGPLPEGITERGLGGVSRHLRCLRQRRALPQEHRCPLHAKTREIREGWLSNELREARRERRTREANLFRESGDRPRLLRPLVH